MYVFTNLTTIDALILKNRSADLEESNNFDVGFKKNFQQVFGITWWTYPFPFFVNGDP